MAKTQETKASYVWEGKMVHAVYSYVTDEVVTEPVALEDVLATIENAPALSELRMLRTTVKKLADDKFFVCAKLRYVPEAESESK